MVFYGKQPGIYISWKACNHQVTGYKHNLYKGFKTLEQAQITWAEFFAEGLHEKQQPQMVNNVNPPPPVAIQGHQPPPVALQVRPPPAAPQVHPQPAAPQVPLHGENMIRDIIIVGLIVWIVYHQLF